MAGFKRDVDIEIEDIETDIDDLEDFEEDDDDIINTVARGKGVGRSNSPRSRNQSDEDDGEVIRQRKPNNGDDKKVLFIVGGVVIVVIVIAIFFFVSSSKKKEAELLALQMQQQEESSKNSNTESTVKPGIPSFSGVGAEENDEYLYDPSLVTKDLNGNQVPTNYVVDDSETVTDYITYKKFRAPTGNGLEFYWLEAEYKGQPYKVQVPYSVYSKLDYSGITVVDMEVLELEDGSKMVNYMKVREDAKSLLEDN